MTSRSMSPRRRHILSSINPDVAPARPRPPRPPSKSPSGGARLDETSSFSHRAAAAGAAVDPSETPRQATDAGDSNTPPREDKEHGRQHEDRRHRRRMTAEEEEAGRDRDGGEECEQQHRMKRTSKFRFKSKSSKSSSSGARHHHSSRSHRNRDCDNDYGLGEDRGEQDGLEPRLGRDDGDKREVHREPAAAHNDDRDRDRDADDHDKESASSPRRDRYHHRRHHDDDKDGGSSSRPRRHHHRHKRRRHHDKSDRRTRSPTPPNPHDPPPLDPEAAFRESLFDAMADDEGAAYWEAVYGQPIHVYGGGGGGGSNPRGELEQMDDDEYAAHVRQKMWEKTHEGLLEERARREERRRQKAQEREGAAELTREMERSLRRGEERRRRRAWQDKWERYVAGWEKWNNSSRNSDDKHAGGGALDVQGIPWPVESGQQADIEASAVREFFITAIDPQDVGEAEYHARLKNERVRWHPDKIQQRLGGKVDGDVMRSVTAVFQVLDKLWSDARTASKPS
ncbi:hypothetical protein MN608_00431 [Microdochium nivale]|nr:hypothetical protein MN608_00431 [Microdochium nivale]